MKHNRSTYLRAKQICKEVEERYIPETQSHSVANVCRTYLQRTTALSERTYYRYRKLVEEWKEPPPKIDYSKSLFPELAIETTDNLS